MLNLWFCCCNMVRASFQIYRGSCSFAGKSSWRMLFGVPCLCLQLYSLYNKRFRVRNCPFQGVPFAMICTRVYHIFVLVSVTRRASQVSGLLSFLISRLLSHFKIWEQEIYLLIDSSSYLCAAGVWLYMYKRSPISFLDILFLTPPDTMPSLLNFFSSFYSCFCELPLGFLWSNTTTAPLPFPCFLWNTVQKLRFFNDYEQHFNTAIEYFDWSWVLRREIDFF